MQKNDRLDKNCLSPCRKRVPLTISKPNKILLPRPESAAVAPLREKLTEGRLLMRNTGINFVGQAGPLFIAFFTVPVLIQKLGVDRFGVLTLAWIVIGYFSFLDIGLGRALTKFLAERLGVGQEEGLPALVWTSLFLMLVLGLIGTVLAGLLSPWLAHRALNIPIGLQTETLYSFYMLALTIPVVITTVGIRGVLEANQRFGFINTARIINGGMYIFNSTCGLALFE